MTLGKRLFDVVCAVGVAVLVSPYILWVCYQIWREGDGPILYVAERMKTPDQSFGLLKFRTMTVSASQDAGVTGGDKSQRITPLGAKLRKYRLDELPQVWNLIKGDISFVGPRPPLREYVEKFPDLYAEVLQSRPGLTGLATLVYHRREAELLANCKTPEETDATYCNICIPAKAKLDLMYQRRYRPCLDYWIIWSTLKQLSSKKRNKP